MSKPWPVSWTLAVVVAVAAAGAASETRAASDYLGTLPPEDHTVPPITGQVCAGCHGAKGVAIASMFPNLAGQGYNYLLKQLEAFRQGDREASPMSSIITEVHATPGNEALKLIAGYFSRLDLVRGDTGPKPSKHDLETGRDLYAQGLRNAGVPACSACHSADGLGVVPMAVPRLAGQNAAYVVSQLQAFASGKRHNSPDGVMGRIAGHLDDGQMKAIAAYLQELPPGKDSDRPAPKRSAAGSG